MQTKKARGSLTWSVYLKSYFHITRPGGAYKVTPPAVLHYPYTPRGFTRSGRDIFACWQGKQPRRSSESHLSGVRVIPDGAPRLHLPVPWDRREVCWREEAGIPTFPLFSHKFFFNNLSVIVTMSSSKHCIFCVYFPGDTEVQHHLSLWHGHLVAKSVSLQTRLSGSSISSSQDYVIG